MSDTKRPIDMAADHVREHLPGIPVYVHGGGRSMVSIVEFLTARLDEREEAARFTLDLIERSHPADEFDIEWRWAKISRHKTSGGSGSTFELGAPSPAEVLADIAAKRAIVALHTPQAPDYGCPTCWEGVEDGGPMAHPCPTLRHLASADSDHRDYREDWRHAMSSASIHPTPDGQPDKLVGTDFEIPTRVYSEDYGKGNIVADFDAMGIQIYWDHVITGTVSTHLLVHDRTWVSELQKLPPEKP